MGAIQEPLVLAAMTASQLALAADLFREYAASLPFSLCFQGFDEEVASLPGKYAPPAGRILLAYDGPDAVGCIALRPLPHVGEGVCEMKRMYVKPSHRGLGIGRLLADHLLAEARAAGYRVMKLDSEFDMTAAVTLYRSLGFKDCERYNNDPHPHTVWMELVLEG